MSILGKMFGFAHNETYNKGIHYYDQEKYEEAITQFRLIIDQKVEADHVTVKLAHFYTAEAYAQIGQNAMKRGDWEVAEQAYFNALQRQPRYADLHYFRAFTLRKLHRYEEAVLSIRQALDINQRFAKAIILDGILMYEMNRQDDGISRIKEAIALKPELRNGRFETAMEYHERGEYSNAVGAFETIAATESEEILFHARLGDELLKQRRYEEALQEYKMAIGINPRYADIRNNCGLTYMELGKYAEAIEEFNAAVNINQKYVDAWVNLALAYNKIGNTTDSQISFGRVLELDPTNQVAFNHYKAA